MSPVHAQKTKTEEIVAFKRPPFYALYLAIFLFSLTFALPLYINSSFLATLVSEKLIGFLYAAEAAFSFLLLLQFPRILQKLGNWRAALLFVALQGLALLALAYFKTPLLIIPVFIATQVFGGLILFNFDVFFEAFSKDKQTGEIRGLMLTVVNIAILLGPLTSGIILTDGDYFRVYLAAAALLIPVFLILAARLKGFEDPHYKKIPYLLTLKKIIFASHPQDEIRHAVLAGLFMRFFFSWMVIYMPLYLHASLGFDWKEIGIMFTVMLLPFVLFEAPLGKIVDAKGNEKSVLISGFLITTFFTALLPFIATHTVLLWALLLFGTRVGMSFVEIASESYFFKHISARDTDTLSLFRNTRPIAYLAGAASASILLFIVPLQFLFLILALLMLCGAWNASMMKDGGASD